MAGAYEPPSAVERVTSERLGVIPTVGGAGKVRSGQWRGERGRLRRRRLTARPGQTITARGWPERFARGGTGDADRRGASDTGLRCRADRRRGRRRQGRRQEGGNPRVRN